MIYKNLNQESKEHIKLYEICYYIFRISLYKSQ